MYRLHEVLLDCTCYENSALAEASMGLLIRTFEQQQTLSKNAHSVQLLSKKRMKARYVLFEELLRQLTKHTLALQQRSARLLARRSRNSLPP